MGDRYSLQPNCFVCGQNLEKDQALPLFMAPGESIDLPCSKCGIVWRFWIEIKINQKKIGVQKRKS